MRRESTGSRPVAGRPLFLGMTGIAFFIIYVIHKV
jgi:hypothetical protein